jgi:hypothetical protein
VVTACGQGRKDVIITASIMALENCFQAEFWITSVSPYPPESPGEYLFCDEDPGPIPYGFPGCDANTGNNDRRGTIWFCGSLAQNCGGRFNRNPPPGNATIGYMVRQNRYDPNLRVSAPPFWPELEWIDEDPPSVEVSAAGQELCGSVLYGEEFLQPFVNGDISLQITAHPQGQGGREELRITAWLDGQAVETRLDTLITGSSLAYQPGFDLPFEENHELYFTVEWDAQTWNPGGSQCRWIFELEDLDPPTITQSPALSAWCGQPVDWFEFHSQWVSEEIYLDVSASPQAAGGSKPSGWRPGSTASAPTAPPSSWRRVRISATGPPCCRTARTRSAACMSAPTGTTRAGTRAVHCADSIFPTQIPPS